MRGFDFYIFMIELERVDFLDFCNLCSFIIFMGLKKRSKANYPDVFGACVMAKKKSAYAIERQIAISMIVDGNIKR